MIFPSLFPDDPLNQNLKLLPLLQKIISNQSEADPTFLIEINAQVRSTKQQPKPGNINGGKNNSLFGFDGSYWVAAECTLKTIKALVLEGFCLRLGVKIGGVNYRHHFDSASFCYLDVDLGSTIQHSVDLFQDLAFLVYASPSYTKENQKHRIVIRFSEPVTDYLEVETILKLFIQQHDFLDPSCCDPSRVMFGSFETEFFYSETNVLDLAEYRASEEFQLVYTELKNPRSRGVDTANKDLPYYYTELALTGDLTALCQHVGLDYDFEFQSVTPDDGTLLKWQGRNPFSATNSSGTSLVVSLKNNDLLVYDRANNQGGNFLRFYHSMKEGYSSFVEQELDKESYQKLLKQFISNFHSNQESVPSQSLDDLYFIPDPAKPDKKQLKDIVIILETYIYPEMKSSFHFYNDSDKEESLGVLYYHYDVNHGWKISQSLDLLKTLIVSTFRKVFGSTPISKIVNALTSNVLISLPTYFALSYQPVQDFTYIFFADKMFNLKTKKLEDYDPKVWHFKRLNYAYQEPTNRALLLALEALKRSKVSKKDQRILLNSFILSSQNQYHKTTCMLYLYGESTSGKSTAAKVFGDSQNCPSHTALTTTLNVDHFGSILDTVTILDEVTNVNAIISLLMSLVRDTNEAGNLFRVCNKYVRARMKRLPITLILTGESLTLGTMTTGQIGQTKRLVTVEFVQKVEGENNPWMRFNEDSTLAQELFCWAINQDYARLPQRIRWIRSLTISNKEQKARMDDLLQSTDPIYEFIGTTREDTATDTKGYTPFDIQTCYTAMTNEPFKGSARKRFMDTFSREMKKKYPDSFSKSRQRKDENDQSLRYYGFKILPHSND